MTPLYDEKVHLLVSAVPSGGTDTAVSDRRRIGPCLPHPGDRYHAKISTLFDQSITLAGE